MRIKTDKGRGGYERNVTMLNITMERVKVPIRFSRGASDHPDEKFDPRALPKVKGISIIDVVIVDSRKGPLLQGIEVAPFEDICMKYVTRFITINNLELSSVPPFRFKAGLYKCKAGPGVFGKSRQLSNCFLAGLFIPATMGKKKTSQTSVLKLKPVVRGMKKDAIQSTAFWEELCADSPSVSQTLCAEDMVSKDSNGEPQTPKDSQHADGKGVESGSKQVGTKIGQVSGNTKEPTAQSNPADQNGSDIGADKTGMRKSGENSETQQREQDDEVQNQFNVVDRNKNRNNQKRQKNARQETRPLNGLKAASNEKLKGKLDESHLAVAKKDKTKGNRAVCRLPSNDWRSGVLRAT
ncbi:probable polygalacturonase [Olea europaea subsp. europaea]|uniref:Probable polygalacturonase n=1 Tax=Olea europaea subsp. europaea TaxID=158383 RepID=A0A8S0UXJ1_OLEEU|nr:probable polygalacturonase [Olea europaea subsp. europaea]